MALVEETIEVFMRINKVLGTDYTQMKQGQWLHFVSERRQVTSPVPSRSETSFKGEGT